jgi:hypothetical protein
LACSLWLSLALSDPKNQLYVYSFYWAIVTFNTLGYGDLHPFSTAEVVFTIFYISCNMVLWAYILGTMSLLVVKDDEVTGRYRARMSNLLLYCTSNKLPPVGDGQDTRAGQKGDSVIVVAPTGCTLMLMLCDVPSAVAILPAVAAAAAAAAAAVEGCGRLLSAVQLGVSRAGPAGWCWVPCK